MENFSNVQEVYLNKVFFSLLAIWTTQNTILQICTTKCLSLILKNIFHYGVLWVFFVSIWVRPVLLSQLVIALFFQVALALSCHNPKSRSTEMLYCYVGNHYVDSTFVSFLRRTDRIAAVPISVISDNTESAQENQR